ncbi:MAG: hypothetical protein ACRDBG_01900 [Waterburya sp.]
MITEEKEDQVNDQDNMIKDKIMHALEVFPFISHAMLQIALGTALPASIWRPLLDEFIAAGIVTEKKLTAKTSTGRTNTYKVYHLSETSVSDWYNNYCARFITDDVECV